MAGPDPVATARATGLSEDDQGASLCDNAMRELDLTTINQRG